MTTPKESSNIRTDTQKRKRKTPTNLVPVSIRTQKKTVKLKRFEGNPIISPKAENRWESLATTNPGAWYDKETGKVVLLYRAAGNDTEHIIHLGLATSNDGYQFKRYDEPALSPSKDGLDGGCLEDARIVKIGQYYYITYATRVFPPGEYWLKNGDCYKNPSCPEEFPLCVKENHTTSHLLITKDFKEFIRVGRLTDPMVNDRDVILFPEKINGQFYMLHRPMEWHGKGFGTNYPAIWISAASDLLNFKKSTLLAKAQFPWERKIGANTPPIRTDIGWLTVYHAVGEDKFYRLGAMLLDLDDPTKVKYRTRHWILQPEKDYETHGYYFGGGVVFPCGKVIIDDELFVYYGAADKYVGLATCKVDELLDYLVQCPVEVRE